MKIKVLPRYAALACTVLIIMIVSSCTSNSDVKEEQISINRALETNEDTSQVNSIKGNLSLTQLSSSPNSVILTGLAQHRLVTIYKSNVGVKSTDERYSGSSSRDYDYYDSEREQHFMPGLDLIHGYNLLNVAHYDLVTEHLNHLFEQPVLVKSLYYPSFIQDSLEKKPVTRNYYLVSVYDADTNTDTLINKKDLRRLYSFNATCSEKVQLIPADYSAERSQYDSMNDVMYIFARFDLNHNGMVDKTEPLHIFWFSLKAPAKAKRMY